MTTMAHCNYVIAAITALIGALIAYTSYGYGIEMTMFGPGAGFWPFVLGMCLILVAVLLTVDTFRKHDLFSREMVILLSYDQTTAYKMMGVTIAYVLLLSVIGFYPATLLFLFSSMYLLGGRNLQMMAAVTLGFVGVIFLIFDELLHISFPLPFFLN